MATKSRATRGGKYVCKIGNFDIRHKITPPKKGKNLKGDIIMTPGSVESSIYLGGKLYKSGFKDHKEAIQHAWDDVKKSNLQHIVDKSLISKYNLV